MNLRFAATAFHLTPPRLAFASISQVARRLSTVSPNAMEKVDTTSRLTKLRALMKERQVHVYSESTANHHSAAQNRRLTII